LPREDDDEEDEDLGELDSDELHTLRPRSFTGVLIAALRTSDDLEGPGAVAGAGALAGAAGASKGRWRFSDTTISSCSRRRRRRRPESILSSTVWLACSSLTILRLGLWGLGKTLPLTDPPLTATAGTSKRFVGAAGKSKRFVGRSDFCRGIPKRS